MLTFALAILTGIVCTELPGDALHVGCSSSEFEDRCDVHPMEARHWRRPSEREMPRYRPPYSGDCYRDEFDATVRRREHALRTCYGQSVPQDRLVVSLEFRILPDGSVIELRAHSPSPELSACFLKSLGVLRFRPREGECRVNWL